MPTTPKLCSTVSCIEGRPSAGGELRRESANDAAQFGELGGGRIDGGDSRWPGSSGRAPPLRTLWTQAACTVLGRPRHPSALLFQGGLHGCGEVLHRFRGRLGS